jgi:hypothetical protein
LRSTDMDIAPRENTNTNKTETPVEQPPSQIIKTSP